MLMMSIDLQLMTSMPMEAIGTVLASRAGHDRDIASHYPTCVVGPVLAQSVPASDAAGPETGPFDCRESVPVYRRRSVVGRRSLGWPVRQRAARRSSSALLVEAAGVCLAFPASDLLVEGSLARSLPMPLTKCSISCGL